MRAARDEAKALQRPRCKIERRQSFKADPGKCPLGQKPDIVQTREKIIVGATVLGDVELEAVPADWGPTLTKYRYVCSSDRVMLVDPARRTVVQEID
jgi:hypothetical protein